MKTRFIIISILKILIHRERKGGGEEDLYELRTSSVSILKLNAKSFSIDIDINLQLLFKSTFASKIPITNYLSPPTSTPILFEYIF